MAGYERRDDRAQRQARDALARMGQEIGSARLGLGLSQAAAGGAIGLSKSSWSRIERGQAAGLPVSQLARALAVVGLDLHIRAYPGGAPVRDAAHLALLERLRVRLGPMVTGAPRCPCLGEAISARGMPWSESSRFVSA